jgi:hypothetical protein
VAVVRRLRLEESRTSPEESTFGRDPHADSDEPSLQDVQNLVRGIRAQTGPLSFAMCTHILYGSKGPKVAALVSAYALTEYGLLHDVGFGRIKRLIKEALIQQLEVPGVAPDLHSLDT